MRLLILTQKIDINDDLLGFFHHWLEKFAEKFEKIIVICLQKGEYNLPPNIKILSLGKEDSYSRWKYLFRFYKYVFKERNNYEAVFVHMNQIYVILGGLFWRLQNKKIGFWYNHRQGTFLTRMAGLLANIVFHTSPLAFTARFKKAKIMPVGIDTERFSTQGGKIKNSILYLGRISPVKNLDILIEAVRLLDQNKIPFILNIVGEPGEKDEDYFKKIKDSSLELEKEGKIRFWGGVPNYKTPALYSQNEIFANLTDSGSLDKTIFEAMACQTLVLVSNRSFENILPPQFIFAEKNAEDLSEKIISLSGLTTEEKNKYALNFRKYVEENHSLDNLIKKLCNTII